jgi:IS1 family transposase
MPSKPAPTPATATTKSWLFPPQTQEAQFDEKWAFVGKKQKHCDARRRADARQGDCWDHVAYDPEHRLVVSVVVGKRTEAHARQVVYEFRERTDGRFINLMTSDEYPASAAALQELYAEPAVPAPAPAQAEAAAAPVRLPEWLVYATVHKVREQERVVRVEARVVFGTLLLLAATLLWSVVSGCVNTAFVERYHGTDRGRNSRKARKTARFSKDWGVHAAMTYFTMYSDNFCWPVRTLRERDADGKLGPERTPAMAAGLADHVWPLEEWLLFPSRNLYRLPPLSSY